MPPYYEGKSIKSKGWCYTQGGPAYNHLGYTQDCPANSKKNTEMRYMQDCHAYNHFGYMQDSNLTNPKPNPNLNLNLLTLTVTLVQVWFVLIKLTAHANHHFFASKNI